MKLARCVPRDTDVFRPMSVLLLERQLYQLLVHAASGIASRGVCGVAAFLPLAKPGAVCRGMQFQDAGGSCVQGHALKPIRNDMRWVGRCQYHEGEGWVQLAWWPDLLPSLVGLKLAKVGTNLNQVAKAFNTLVKMRGAEKLPEVGKKIASLRREITEHTGKVLRVLEAGTTVWEAKGRGQRQRKRK